MSEVLIDGFWSLFQTGVGIREIAKFTRRMDVVSLIDKVGGREINGINFMNYLLKQICISWKS